MLEAVFGFSQFVSKSGKVCSDSCNLLKRLVAGEDLNLRPLGYEFNSWFLVDSVIAKNQQDTVLFCLILPAVSGSLVSTSHIAAN
jgi:hypothetical protein